MSQLKHHGRRGQIIILFAILYVGLILNLLHILPSFIEEHESPFSHVKIINLMLKRITDASLAWASNGGNFSQYLNWCLDNLSKYYPVIVTVLDYSVTIEEQLRQATVTYLISYLPFNLQYRLQCTSKFQVSTIASLTSSSPSPSFKSKLFEIKLLSDELYPLDSNSFSALFFDGYKWHLTYVKVTFSNTSYLIALTVPLNATLIKLLIGDWRGITISILFKT
ncbi:MAG: hypothetical protein NDF54_04075 [archaeon GB-1867-035]|nr:hypothetical protein [Candidatus Culexmicrobium profundum]